MEAEVREGPGMSPAMSFYVRWEERRNRQAGSQAE